MDNVEAACKLIKRNRENSKLNKSKTVNVKLFKEDKYTVSAFLSIKTSRTLYGNPSFAHGLKYRRISISPTTNNKLKCINEAGLLNLQKSRKVSNKNYVNCGHLNFHETLNSNPNIGLLERVRFNMKTGNVSCSTQFNSSEKLIFIDIE